MSMQRRSQSKESAETLEEWETKQSERQGGLTTQRNKVTNILLLSVGTSESIFICFRHVLRLTTCKATEEELLNSKCI